MDLQDMRASKMKNVDKIIKYLPGFNCGACGYKRCDLFAEDLLNGNVNLEDCPYLLRERFKENHKILKEILNIEEESSNKKYVGVIDGYIADFLLKPLKNECSCRETLLIMDKKELKVGDYIKYRPLGCPIPHFAKIIDIYHGLYIIHVIGPYHRIEEKNKTRYKDVGIAIVVAFEGIVEGKVPEVGKTVRFIPKHCMMQKVHSGVVVQVEGKKAYIESIDLKVF